MTREDWRRLLRAKQRLPRKRFLKDLHLVYPALSVLPAEPWELEKCKTIPGYVPSVSHPRPATYLGQPISYDSSPSHVKTGESLFAFLTRAQREFREALTKSCPPQDYGPPGVWQTIYDERPDRPELPEPPKAA